MADNFFSPPVVAPLLPQVQQAYQNDPRRTLIAALLAQNQREMETPTYNVGSALAKTLGGIAPELASAYVAKQYQDTNASALKTMQDAIGSMTDAGAGTGGTSSMPPQYANLSKLAQTLASNPATAQQGFSLAAEIQKATLANQLAIAKEDASKGYTTDASGNVVPRPGYAGSTFAQNQAASAGTESGAAPYKVQTAVDIAKNTAPIEVNKAVDIAARTLPIEIRKSLAGQGLTFGPNGEVSAIPGYGGAAADIAGQKAAKVSEAELPSKVVENAASYGLRPIVRTPTESVVTGLGAYPTWLQDAIHSALGANGVPGGAAGAPTAATPGVPALTPENQKNIADFVHQVEGAGPVPGAGGGGAQPTPPAAVPPQTQPPVPSPVVPQGAPQQVAPGIPAAPMALQGVPQGLPQAVPAQPPRAAIPAPGQSGIPPMMTVTQYNAEDQLGKEFADKDRKAYTSANNALGNLAQINNSIELLNRNGGWSATGTGANDRIGLAKAANTFATAFGMTPPFDPNKIANWESFNKQTKLMGMEVINKYFGGSREAASIINGATSAVPNSENTYLGARLVSSGIEQELQRERELYQFKADRVANGQPLATAETDFNKTNPVQLYTLRAIANAVPDQIAAHLVQNPQTVGDFDKTFGKGIGEIILKGQRTPMGSAGMTLQGQ